MRPTSKHIGRQFGQLTVIEIAHTYRVGRTGYVQIARCRCTCGQEREVVMNTLRAGGTQRCEACQAKAYETQSAAGYKHPLYNKWISMLQRCHWSKSPAYKWYGARGIYVCDRWRCAGPGELGTIEGFRNFVADMGECPPGMTIERNDNDGPYSPDNCRWATMAEQAVNKRPNRLITHAGVTMTVSEWAGVKGLTAAALSARLTNGWSIELALTTPLRPKKRNARVS